MLVLARKVGERIRIGDDVVITLVRLDSNSVRLGIEAPTDVNIIREEVGPLVPVYSLDLAARPHIPSIQDHYVGAGMWDGEPD